jgi:hypothetical protein
MVTAAKNITRVQKMAFKHPSQDQGCPQLREPNIPCSLQPTFREVLALALVTFVLLPEDSRFEVIRHLGLT